MIGVRYPKQPKSESGNGVAEGEDMKNRGWRGDPPADDAEARDRIIAAAMRCIDRHGPIKTGLSDVAAELGITRQTVYRLFPSTDDLFQAVSVTAADSFVDQMVARVSRLIEPAAMLTECIAFTIERLRDERYLSLLFDRGQEAFIEQQFTSSLPSELTERLLTRLPVDWTELGISGRKVDLLIEIYLRTLLSFLVDPGPARSGRELRTILRHWLTPAILSLRDDSEVG
jgi:AcrR family transcriptional regulator